MKSQNRSVKLEAPDLRTNRNIATKVGNAQPEAPSLCSQANPSPPVQLAAKEFCCLCREARNVELLYHLKGQDVVRCEACGLVYVARGSASFDARTLYSRSYFEGGAVDGYTDYGTSEDVLRHQAKRTLWRLRRFVSSGRLLEIGCAYGFFLKEAKNYFEAEGIEISSFAAQEARKRGLKVIEGDFKEIEVPASHYSAVCLFDCIEHLTDPFAYLEKVYSVLRPGGVLALTTGDISALSARIAGPKWRLMTPPQHLFFFSRTTLNKMLEKTGFQPLELSYPWKLVPLGLILYQISPRLQEVLGPAARLRLGVYVNLFDAMFVICKKP